MTEQSKSLMARLYDGEEPKNIIEDAEDELRRLRPVREWQGLTEEEIAELFEDGLGFEHGTVIARAIEAKLREKNA